LYIETVLSDVSHVYEIVHYMMIMMRTTTIDDDDDDDDDTFIVLVQFRGILCPLFVVKMSII